MKSHVTFVLCCFVFLVVIVQLAHAQNFWQAVNIPSITGNVNALAANPTGTIFAATEGDGIFRSTNEGTTWTHLTTGGSKNHFYCLGIGPNGTVYAGSYAGTVYRSKDNGNAWTSVQVIDGSDTARSIVTAFAFQSGKVYMSTGLHGMFVSDDDGDTWSTVEVTFSFPFSMAFDSKKNLLVGTYGGSIYTSPTSRIQWSSPDFSIFSHYRIRIEQDVTTDSGTFGDTVIYHINRFGRKAIIDSARIGNSVIVRDSTFEIVYSRRFQQPPLRVNTFAVGANGQVFAGTDFGVFCQTYYLDSTRSSESPDTVYYWKEVNYKISDKFVLSLIDAPNGHLYAGTFGDGVLRSTDGGETWTQADTGITYTNNRTTLCLNPSDFLFCGTKNGGVYKSISPVSSSAPLVTNRNGVGQIRFSLEQGYPNPFNPVATIPFTVYRPGDVSLKIYNSLGQVVATLVNGILGSGRYQIPWNASNFPSGVYFYRMQSASEVQSGKLLLTK